MTRMSEPPMEYLRDCSNTSLRYFELSKLEHVANLRRELVVLLDEMMEESALALFARWMLEKRSNSNGASRNGRGAKSLDSKRARAVLAQFFSAAPIVGEPSGAASAAAEKARAEAPSRGETAEAAGAVSPDAEQHSRELASPEPSAPRAERRTERRTARCTRMSGRECVEDPERL